MKLKTNLTACYNWGLYLLSLILLTACSQSEQKAEVIDYTHFVDPMVGTAEYGHCFPGACVPFGLIQAGPETGNCNWKYCAGYQSSDSIINGFSQTRLNGTGCMDLGDLLLQPFTGEATKEGFKSIFDKNTEGAEPGYYAVVLKSFGVKAEITATNHVAMHQYTYPEGKTARLMIDFQSALSNDLDQLKSHVLDAKVNLEDETTISGYSHTSTWVERTYYYVIKFSNPYTKKTILPKNDIREKAPQYILDFDLKADEKLMVKISISSTSIDGAKANLTAELNDWDFDQTHQKAKAAWNTCLSRVDIEGDADKKVMFYTSMYRLFIQPNNIADAGKEPFYSTLSLWDTYRAAHPLYTILSPERVDGFVNSMLHQYDLQGFLPIWALWGKETYCMIGNHAVPVIVDAYLKGFKGFDAERAYQAVKTSLTVNHRNSDWDTYMKYEYYPCDLVTVESVSRTLETSYDDHCAALFAKALGHTEDYKYFKKRSHFYKNLFDPSTKLMRGKDSHGNWRTPFEPLALSHASTSGGDYTEGNAWQYTWQVQHDIKGLIKLMGSEESFVARLDSLFNMESTQIGKGFVMDVTGLIGQYAHGNEPSHHVAYLYGMGGKHWKTQEMVHKICKTEYINKVDGLCGNDDCGQMSAWYIFSNLGFYPVDPCGGEYVLGAPQVEKATINLPEGKTFTVEAIYFSEDNIYVQSVEFNGQLYEKKYITQEDIMQGGTLRFVMGSHHKKM